METQSQNTPNVGTERSTPNSNDASRGNRSPPLRTPTPPANDHADDHAAGETDHQTSEAGPSAENPENEVVTDKEAIFAAIMSQISEEDTADLWVMSLCRKIKSRFHRMPRGWWNKIKDAFNQKFDLACTLTDVKNRYSRVKSQLDREAAAGEESTNRDSPLPMAVANAELYNKVKNALLGNV